ncbi:MAG: nucleotidyltransferase family protein [bacterium]
MNLNERNLELEAIILAGGYGTRLKAAIADIPKSIAMVNRQPFLNYLLNYLSNFNIQKVILATGHLHHKIESLYGKSYKNIKIEYSIEKELLGTGGGIKQAVRKVSSEHILILNGDTFFNVNLDDMLAIHESNKADLTIALKPMYNISRYGSVKIEGTHVKSFEEKKRVKFGYINGGVYLSTIHLFDAFDLPEKFSIEEDFLKKFTSQLNIHACISDAYFIDIGIPEDYQKAQIEMRAYE